MPVSLPERTVDAWVVAYLVKRVPNALLWAPTQRQTPDYDIASSVPGPGKLFVLEDKAPYIDGQHEFTLPVRRCGITYATCSFTDERFTFCRVPHFPSPRCRERQVLPVVGVPSLSQGGRVRGSPVIRGRQPPVVRIGFASCPSWTCGLFASGLRRRRLALRIGAKDGRAPLGAPAVERVTLTCPLPDGLGESLKTFIDRLIRCDRPLWVDPEQPDDTGLAFDGGGDTPLFQALVAYAPASSLEGS